MANKISPISDVHLVLDYYADQSWGNLRPTRSNRFYANMDFDNKILTSLDTFHEELESFNSDIIVITGF